VLICTYRRASIEETLRSIEAQIVPDNFDIRAIVADNDECPTARDKVSQIASMMCRPVLYRHAPARNISIARNACLDASDADWVAFIDDDGVAAPTWIASLYRHAEHRFDAVFGPAIARYDGAAPHWISSSDYHSNRPQMRGHEVQTGHTCNALIRWRGGRFFTERFLLEKGRSGGEDTEFFFRLWRAGARFGICEDARVYETVGPERLTFAWIRSRKFRAGQSYGKHSLDAASSGSIRLGIAATAKVAACATMATLMAASASKRRYWMLRAMFHCGVLTAQFGARERALYGS
jgi:succinoglycan biosynthesis protein ExoM